jgi:ABC-type proline/glycine betaine transport system permease subunit
MDNATFFTADRTTHLKIVVIALAASIVIGLVGIAAHMTPAGSVSRVETSAVAKAGKSRVVGQGNAVIIR